MTSEQIKQVREAATLLLRWHVGGIESDESHPWHAMDYDDKGYEETEALKVACGFALSLVGTDGEEFPDLDWLKQEWGAWRHMQPASSFNHTIGEGDCVIVFWFDFDKSNIKWSIKVNDKAIWLPPITTRYQFRLLAAALGIKRKGE